MLIVQRVRSPALVDGCGLGGTSLPRRPPASGPDMSALEARGPKDHDARGEVELGGEPEAKRFETGRDAVGDQADFAEIADQPVMQVAAEVLAEGGLLAARGAFA